MRNLSLLKTMIIFLFFDICHYFKQWQTHARFVTLKIVTIFMFLIFVIVLNNDKPMHDLSLLKIVTISFFVTVLNSDNIVRNKVW